jgi:hypothetical protein
LPSLPVHIRTHRITAAPVCPRWRSVDIPGARTAAAGNARRDRLQFGFFFSIAEASSL